MTLPRLRSVLASALASLRRRTSRRVASSVHAAVHEVPGLIAEGYVIAYPLPRQGVDCVVMRWGC